MEYQKYEPREQLQNYLRYFWSLSDYSAQNRMERLLMPDTDTFLFIHRQGECFVGLSEEKQNPAPPVWASTPLREPLRVSFSHIGLLVGVCLKPGAARALKLFTPEQDKTFFPDLYIREVQHEHRTILESCLTKPPPEAVDRIQHYLMSLVSESSSDPTALANTAFFKELEEVQIPGKRELARLSRCQGCSLRNLERACKGCTGYTPREYAAIRTCARARHLIRSRQYTSLTDLAINLGFCDQAHFCKVFRRWSGMSPGRYAKYCASGDQAS
ncbi:Helix-turn-helix domain-containing protein [Alkalispirochaeta americana]|uniref:Helix-turn-helix domain-containing protein n=1 Tax=Alkalispirochaeta americana TaxID=159291 RepID=A0A1N6Q722_9SPIO|nr:AraC family transcriptional regulator [Alkalispirochaeta americana]SIQ12312.1 Helix-turn-helix domain-containing protein [Alkalispirochaeta americana]